MLGMSGSRRQNDPMSFVLVVNLHPDQSPKLGDLEFEKAESCSERRPVEPEGIGRARAQTRVGWRGSRERDGG